MEIAFWLFYFCPFGFLLINARQNENKKPNKKKQRGKQKKGGGVWNKRLGVLQLGFFV